MKRTFEGCRSLKFIVTGIIADYDAFEEYYYATYNCNLRFDMDFHIHAHDTGIIDCIYCWCKPVNKNSIKYDSSDEGYELRSLNMDAIINVVGDVDIDKHGEYEVFWDDKFKDLFIIVKYQSMSSDKQKIIDELVNKYYTKMVETFNKGKDKFVNLRKVLGY